MSDAVVTEIMAHPETGATPTDVSTGFLNRNGLEASGHGVGPLLHKVAAFALTGVLAVGAFNFVRNYFESKRGASAGNEYA